MCDVVLPPPCLLPQARGLHFLVVTVRAWVEIACFAGLLASASAPGAFAQHVAALLCVWLVGVLVLARSRRVWVVRVVVLVVLVVLLVVWVVVVHHPGAQPFALDTQIEFGQGGACLAALSTQNTVRQWPIVAHGL